jgi:hypothetical protein
MLLGASLIGAALIQLSPRVLQLLRRVAVLFLQTGDGTGRALALCGRL